MRERDSEPVDKTAAAAARIAVQHFLKGTRFTSPEDCVNAGEKTVEEWCHVLGQAKAGALQPLQGRTQADAAREARAARSRIVNVNDVPADARLVLEVISARDSAHVDAIQSETNMTRPQINSLCVALKRRGFLAIVGTFTYQITPEGMAYLERHAMGDGEIGDAA